MPSAARIRKAVRRTLDEESLRQQVLALEKKGHKRLILVFGEHPHYDAEFMAECVQHVYATRTGHGEIRRVNLNAAPLDHDGYATVKAAGIGTYQIFQETYHHDTYAAFIRLTPARAITSGGLTACRGRWRPSATTWASGPSSGCTIGGSRCWAW